MRQQRRRNQKWTSEEIAFIRDHADQRIDWLANELGSTERAIRNVASRYGIAIKADYSIEYEFDCPDCGEHVLVRAMRERQNRQTRCESCRHAAWRKANNYRSEVTPEQNLLYKARERAKKKGVPFDLTLEDIVIPEVCPVLGIRLVVRAEGIRGAADNSPTLDRLVPALGYVRGNVAVISWRANALKKDGSLAELEAIVAWLRSRLS